MSTLYCQDCGSPRTQRRGGKRYFCRDCGEFKTWKGENGQTYEYTEDRVAGTANIVTSLPRIMTDDDLIDYLKIDENIWQIDKVTYGKSEGYRKDRKVSWKVRNGKVVDGDVQDSGKLLVEPLFTVKVTLSRKTSQIREGEALRQLIEDAKRYSPKPVMNFRNNKQGLLLEIAMPDLHLGKLTWGEETGEDYDIHITSDVVHRVIDQLLAYSTAHPIQKILFPIGNDFFNVDNRDNTTTHGTPQQEDTRWQKTFRFGRVLLTELIDKMNSVAPVDVLVIPGNHDETRSFFLGDTLECWYHNNKFVSVNNKAMKRKYYTFGNSLIGFTHGYWEKPEKLPTIMALEQPECWAQSKYREWHLGDKHHKKDLIWKTNEQDGVVIRILRSLTPPDAWHFDKGYIGAQRAVESLLWDSHAGVIAQYTSTV